MNTPGEPREAVALHPVVRLTCDCGVKSNCNLKTSFDTVSRSSKTIWDCSSDVRIEHAKSLVKQNSDMSNAADKPKCFMSANQSDENPVSGGVGSRELLGCVESELAPIKAQLATLSEKYRNGGEDRIGWEILQAIRGLDETIRLARLYLSGTPLPTLAEIRGIFKEEYGGNPAHAIGTCGHCGEEMVYNVPRLGPNGGYVHKATGKLQCEQPNDKLTP